MNNRFGFFFKYRYITFLVTIIILAHLFSFILDKVNILDKLQRSILDVDFTDFYYSGKKPYLHKIDSNIVIINVGNLSRRDLASLIDKVNKLQPKIIGCDARFLKLKEDTIADNLLARALNNTKNLVMASSLGSADNLSSSTSVVINSNSKFTKYAACGYVNVNIPEENNTYGKIRSFYPAYTINDSVYYAFSVVIAGLYDRKKTGYFLSHVGRTADIKFRGYAFSDPESMRFNSYDYNDLDFIDQHVLKNKIVLLGYIGESRGDYSLEDKFFSPLNKIISGYSFPDIYGVEAQANAISMIINNDFTHYDPVLNGLVIFMILLLCILILDFIITLYRSSYQISSKILILVYINIIILGALFVFEHYSLKLDIRYAIFYLVLAPDVYDFLFFNTNPSKSIS
jgi:CHASE2 domain-containing sensor protein